MSHIPILSVEEATKNFDYSTQDPIHAPNISKLITTSKLETYCMVLIALEENMAEYKAIRDDLDKVFDVICELNVKRERKDSFGTEVRKMEV